MASIIILSGDLVTGNLIMNDHGHTNASRREIITWVIQQGAPNVSTITNIVEKQGSRDIFNPDPRPIGNNWQGTVSPSLKIPASESYSIFWKDFSGNPHQFDPVIQINNDKSKDLTIKKKTKKVVAKV
jgi:hypothetical protein